MAVNAGISALKCQYRQLGASGLRVSVPILGCVSFGDPFGLPWVLGEEEALPLLKAAYDRGINTWDTANVYSHGVSEEIVGKALKKYNIPRERVVIMTKCGLPVDEESRGKPLDPVRLMAVRAEQESMNLAGLSRASIFHQVEASLRRLNMPYIDVLQIHRYDPSTPPQETMQALHDLVRAGKVRYLGASSMWTTQFIKLQTVAKENGLTPFVSMQNYYNLVYREEEREMNRYCRETGVGLIPWSPLAGGRLARPPASEDSGVELTKRAETAKRGLFAGPPEQAQDAEIVKRVQKVAADKGCSMAQVALAWLLHKNRVSSPIFGITKLKQLDDGVQASAVVLTDEEDKFLTELYKPVAVHGHS